MPTLVSFFLFSFFEYIATSNRISFTNNRAYRSVHSELQVSILSLEDSAGIDTKNVMQDTTLDILETIVKYSPKPLSSLLIDTAFPATVQCILRTDDHAIMQSGGECLRAFINGETLPIYLISIDMDREESIRIS